MEFRDYLQVLRKYWVSILILTLVGLIAGGAYSQVAPPVYTSKATVYVSVNAGGSTGDLLQGTSYATAQARSFAQMVTMARVLDPVTQKLGLPMTATQLAAKVTATIPTNTQLIVISVKDDEAARSADIAQSAADSLVETIKEISPTGASAEGEADVTGVVVDPAIAPTAKTSPKLVMSLGLGLVAGLVIGVGLAFMRKLLDRRLHAVSDVADVTTSPVIAAIPFDNAFAKQPVLIVSQPTSPTSEGYRQLRTSLRLEYLDSRAPCLFAVTSSIQGEGKTLTAVNTAFALAEDHARVLLIDADLRRPAVASTLGLDGNAGLTSVLVGRARFDEVVQSLGEGQPDVLAAGPSPLDPGGWLASRRMKALMESVANDYDAVVIDTAPLLPVSDTVALLPYVNSVVLVAAAEKVMVTQLRVALEQVERTGVNLLGIVFNREPRRHSRGSYYAYYGYARHGNDHENSLLVGSPDHRNTARG